MKRIILGTLSLILAFSVQAKKVELQTAQQVGISYYYEHAGQFTNLDFKDLVVTNVFTESEGTVPLYYIFNLSPKGYVIVSADDNIIPVIGYSYESNLEPSKMPEGLKFWMTQVGKEIKRAINENIMADENIKSQWNYYSTRTINNVSIKKSKVIEPLLTSTWNQDTYYNQYCPAATGGPDGKAYAGCVATSMAQIMYYYRYPNTGLGTHGGINFGATTYLWDNMLDNLNNYNEAVALISYHAGKAVNMNYAADGSSAMASDVPAALEDHFKYNTACTYTLKLGSSNYETNMRNNLDAKHPMVYSGSDTDGSGGHAWVCDGYDASYYYHMNWGWSGYANGFFSLSNLTAADSYFGSFQGVVREIYPLTSSYPYSCTGTKNITGTTGTIEDGSGPSDYTNNKDCLWLIAPSETVTKITLSFINFATEATNDVVTVYDGNSISAPVLGTYSGNTLPANVSSSGPQMLVRFQTNGSTTSSGWKATYRSTFPVYCNSITTLTDPSGTITDGSGTENYSYNQFCRWTISPPYATSITLNFSAFNINPNDYVKIYDKVTNTLIDTYIGSTIPSEKTYNTSMLQVHFKSDGYLNSEGFSLDYTSTGSSGVDENNNYTGLNVYPNPANSDLNIQFVINEPESFNLELITMDGKTVYKETQNNFTGIYKNILKTDELAQGVYLLKISGIRQSICKKVVIE